MLVSNNLQINSAGHLEIGGIDTIDLVKEYGTPLYVMDEDLIREHCRQYKKSINEYYEGKGLVCYASKAMSCKEIYRVMKSEGCGVDVVSDGELYTALSVDFPAENIVYHGNNKTAQAIEFAIKNNVGRIVADNLTELFSLNEIAGKLGKKPNIMLRIKPGIDAHTHDFVRTGQIDSKFGFALETGEAMDAALSAGKMENLNLVGIHCHIGSQIFDIAPFKLAGEVMLDFMIEFREKTGATLTDLNLGGGFGIKYTADDTPVPYIEYMKMVAESIKAMAGNNNYPVPFIMIEPGRSVVGPAGITLYTVGARKEIPSIRTYVSVDGGMCDNPRYALYQAKYEAILASKADQPRDDIVTIAGECCESGDLIGENMPLQKAEAGDIVAVMATGAYNYSMASNYNRNMKPPVIMVSEGKSRIIVKRETFEDLVRNDI